MLQRDLVKIVECLDAARARTEPMLLEVGKPQLNALWTATHATGMSHLHFLAPPSLTRTSCVIIPNTSMLDTVNVDIVDP